MQFVCDLYKHGRLTVVSYAIKLSCFLFLTLLLIRTDCLVLSTCIKQNQKAVYKAIAYFNVRRKRKSIRFKLVFYYQLTVWCYRKKYLQFTYMLNIQQNDWFNIFQSYNSFQNAVHKAVAFFKVRRQRKALLRVAL